MDYIYKDRNPSFNSFGQVGLIQTPSAEIIGESVHLTFNQNDIWKFGTLTVSPFDWLEASYFYYRPSDLGFDINFAKGDYLDKGFNMKLLYKSNRSFIPNFALGIDDLAGTGYLSKEYIVSSYNLKYFKSSIGIGWGGLSGTKNFKNPLSLINERFENRPGGLSANYDAGGKLTYDKWFRGPASIFGGFEIFIPKSNGLKLKLEYDPIDYFDFSAKKRPDADPFLRKKDSNINIGLSYPINDFITLNASYLKGNTLNISFSIGTSLGEEKNKKKKFNPKIKTNATKKQDKNLFYLDLLKNLNSNKLFLQTASLNNQGDIDVSVSSQDYRSSIRSSSYAAYIVAQVADSYEFAINSINITQVNAGIELNSIKYTKNNITNASSVPIEIIKSNTKLDSGNMEKYKEYEFKPRVPFPIFFNSVSPSIVSHIGRPSKFYYGGVVLKLSSEAQFSRNLILTSDFNINLVNNFDSLASIPDSKLPHVRTDIVDYLRGSDEYISNLQLDYFWSPKKDIYARLSGGLFEDMYGGAGVELIYKPFDNYYSFGLEVFKVKKRSFKRNFDFLDYSVTTGHLNFSYYLPLGIEAKLSYGKYLAGDVGYTFDVSRRADSGFQAGVYFTRTDVPSEIFGEGSFDKGFYFEIPFDIFSKEYSSASAGFKFSPLTRDGGAKLNYSKDLRGIIFNTTRYEISRDWRGFLD